MRINVVLHGVKTHRAVDGAGVYIDVTELFGKGLGKSAFARTGRTVDGDVDGGHRFISPCFDFVAA